MFMKRYYLGKKYPDIYFTRREAQCMVLFNIGYTNAKTATMLNISLPTVNFYSDAIKKKLNSPYKKNLTKLIMQTDFIYYIESLIKELFNVDS